MLIWKHRKRKRGWVGASGFLLMAGLLPAQAASPNLPALERPSQISTICGQKQSLAGVDNAGFSKGSCDAGGDCCGGFPEATCTRSGGGGYETM